MKPLILLSLVFFARFAWCDVSPETPLLLRHPTISRTKIVFAFANDLWSVNRDGGDAVRLTTGVGIETDPIFSPDGSRIAFTAEYDGIVDVFVIPVAGGTPKRLTYHPAADRAIGWTPDGKQVSFSSSRTSYSRLTRLFTVSAEGGFETQLPLDRAVAGAYSPDGAKIAYVPIDTQPAWKRYRGGQTTPVWIAALADSATVKIPRNNSNDFNPMWVGDSVYFLSDRNGPVTLFAYDTRSRRVTELVKNDGLDFKSSYAGPDAVVYEQFGALHVFDLKTHKTRVVTVRLAGDLAEIRPHFRKVAATELRGGGISPTGARSVFTAHGEILTVPAEKGDIRNLTNTVAVEERDPAWSPDGNSIAYFSDASGEYELEIRDQSGLGEARRIGLGNPPVFPYAPRWSPDSRRIAYTDKTLEVCYVDRDKGTPIRIDADTYAGPLRSDPAWSPDSKWIAYTKQLKSHLHAVFVYSAEQNKTFQITDGMSDAANAQFDKEGKYLYFTASTDAALSNAWLDMSSIQRPVTRSVYLVVLAKDAASPLAPESDEEKPTAPETKKPDDAASKGVPDKKDVAVRIDLENISQRILALPIPARNYTSMSAGKTGVLFLVESPMVSRSWRGRHY